MLMKWGAHRRSAGASLGRVRSGAKKNHANPLKKEKKGILYEGLCSYGAMELWSYVAMELCSYGAM